VFSQVGTSVIYTELWKQSFNPNFKEKGAVPQRSVVLWWGRKEDAGGGLSPSTAVFLYAQRSCLMLLDPF